MVQYKSIIAFFKYENGIDLVIYAVFKVSDKRVKRTRESEAS